MSFTFILPLTTAMLEIIMKGKTRESVPKESLREGVLIKGHFPNLGGVKGDHVVPETALLNFPLEIEALVLDLLGKCWSSPTGRVPGQYEGKIPPRVMWSLCQLVHVHKISPADVKYAEYLGVLGEGHGLA